ncbi:MAG: DUF924 domain-containing protein [Gammaproteobacteria bacterium]|nr:DUF924 domain-containing protein [Gammaproteobacteria bacterium]
MNDDQRIADILAYWFDELDQHGVCSPRQHQLWFQSRPETDAHIEACYGEMVEAARSGGLDHWAEQPDGLMALVLLLDQFTRNICRGTGGAFAGDGKALALVQNAVANGVDRDMPTIHRVFLYIPYEHSEALAAQEQGIALFDQLLRDCSEQVRAEVDRYRDYSVAHRDVIASFGRFPHRNRILGRESTTAEQAHLAKRGGF